MKKIIYLFILLTTICLKAQECKTPEFELKEENNQFINPSSSTLDLNQPNTNTYCIRIKFHFVRNTDGTYFPGSSNPGPNSIPNLINFLNSSYNPLNIYVASSGYDYIDNTNYYNTYVTGSVPSSWNNLSLASYDSNSFNFYINKNSNIFGPNIGNNKVYMDETTFLNNYTQSAHELGHDLGLYHTYHGTNPNSLDTAGCFENLNGSNCLTCGDFVCDTPSSACNGFNGCNRDITNFMDYSDYSFGVTATHFTVGQGLRMRNYIQFYHQNRVSYKCNGISGLSNICSSGNYTYAIPLYSNLTPQPTFVWSVSSNLQIVGSNTGSSITISSSNTANTGNSTLTVVINGIETITKTITMGPPAYDAMNQMIGVYDWVSIGTGNMGMIAPTNPTITSFRWTIGEDPDLPPNCATTAKAKFINSSNPYEYVSTTNQVIINWGTCSSSYLLTCYKRNECGESIYDYRYVDVGSPKNNPCFKNTIHAIVAPNPVTDGRINVLVNKTPQQSPCNWRENYILPEFNHKLDKTQNEVSIYDYNGTMIYSQTYDTDEFTIDKIDLKPANYIIKNITNEGVTSQEVIIVE